MEALSSLQVYLKYLSPEDAMQFCFLYLADANDEIRNKAKSVMLVEGVLDFALPALKAIKYQPGTRRVCVCQYSYTRERFR